MEFFFRYTNLASVIDIVRNRRLTLLNPASWDDKNDSYFMSEYKRIGKYETVLALCFSQCAETYHHWRIFAPGADGVSIAFDRQRLLEATQLELPQSAKLRTRHMEYRTINKAKLKGIQVSDLPFLKRKAFEPENEYRFVYTDRNQVLDAWTLDIQLGWIKKITLSPWLHPTLGISVVDTLKSLPGMSKKRVSLSTLVDTPSWKALALKATTPNSASMHRAAI